MWPLARDCGAVAPREAAMVGHLWIIFEGRKVKSDFLHNFNLRNRLWFLSIFELPSKLFMRVWEIKLLQVTMQKPL